MADEIRRVDTTDDGNRDTVVVREGRKGSVWAVILGIILILIVIFWLFGNPFANEDVDVTPDVNVPNQIDLNVPNPDVNLPDVDVNPAPESTPENNQTAPNSTETSQ